MSASGRCKFCRICYSAGMNTTITPMKVWLQQATTPERELLAQKAGTSSQYLSHVAVNEDKNYRREPKIALAAAIERETAAMAKTSKGRLPVVLRTDLIEGCRQCPYAQKVLGERAVRSEFPIVVVEGSAPAAD